MPDRSGSHPDEEGLLVEAFRLYEENGPAALESLCRQYPARADELRYVCERFKDLGFLRPDAPATFPAQLGEFDLLERLGAGGMGVVYLARQRGLDRLVALKLVRPEHLFFPGSRARFRSEAEAVARLQHPGIVPIYTVGEQDGIPYYAMELVEGCTLDEVLDELRGRDPGRLAGVDLQAAISSRCRAAETGSTHSGFRAGTWVGNCLQVALQVARALEHAHERGVVHRDVKPSNVAVTPEGRALLLDFGVALVEAGGITRTGQPGSLPYMSPEQVLGGRAVDGRTDVYSLGATLRELLTLQAPHREETSEATRRRILNGDFAAIHDQNPRVAWDVETVCRKALEVDPERRYASAGELAADLENLLALRPIAARRPGPGLRLRRWLQRHPARAAALGVGILALGLLAALAAGSRMASAHRVRELHARASALAAEGRLEEAIEVTGIALGLRPGFGATLELRDELLRRSRERTRALLDETLQLADVRRLRELEERAAELWPALPARARDMRIWLAEAGELLAKEATHRDALGRLRANSGRSSGEGDWAFEDPAAGWRHDVLVELLPGFERLRAARADMRERLALAARVAERTLGPETRVRWRETAAEVAALAVYGGLELRPQAGLLPLRRDPHSGLWEFWHPQSGREPRVDARTGELVLDGETAIVLVLVPAGSFSMGSHAPGPEHRVGEPLVDPEHRPGEGPPRELALPAFFLGRTEITQGQWLRLSGSNPSTTTSERDGGSLAHPVESVSWIECMHLLERYGLTLPSEAQWEYAARAGTRTVFWAGNGRESLAGIANLASDSADPRLGGPVPSHPADDGFWLHAPAGRLRPNPWGFSDVHGNVWEWCLDARDDRSQQRASRGGSYALSASFARSACRSGAGEHSRSPQQGARASRALF